MNQRYAILADRTFTPEGISYLCYVHVNGENIESITTAPTDCPVIRLKRKIIITRFCGYPYSWS